MSAEQMDKGTKLDEQLQSSFGNLDQLEGEINNLYVGVAGVGVPPGFDSKPVMPEGVVTLEDILRHEVNRRLENARILLSALNGAIQDTVGQAKVCRVILPPPVPNDPATEDMLRMARQCQTTRRGHPGNW